MIDIKDMGYSPSIAEIGDSIGLPLFEVFCRYMDEEYQAVRKIEYSKDVWARGWNVKFRKAGKSLCVVYPKNKYFTVLVVVSNKEKERVENMLPYLSGELQELYRNTKEGNGQRWLMIDLYSDDESLPGCITAHPHSQRKQIRDRKNGDLPDSFVV